MLAKNVRGSRRWSGRTAECCYTSGSLAFSKLAWFLERFGQGKWAGASLALQDDSWESQHMGRRLSSVPPPFHVGQHRHVWDFLKCFCSTCLCEGPNIWHSHRSAASDTGGASRTRRPQFSHQPLCRGQNRTDDFLTQLTTREDPGQKHTDGCVLLF